MAGTVSAKVKRKDLEEVSDDFSEFSLSSPARKIRRLDAELAPIMEEEEHGVPLVFNQQIPNVQMSSSTTGLESMMTEAELEIPLNDERALVLYNPMKDPLLMSSSNLSFRINSDLLSGLKDRVFRPMNPHLVAVEGTNDCLAVVPWQAPLTFAGTGYDESREVLPMDAEAAEEDSSMEIEEDTESATTGVTAANDDGSHQWQHCMASLLPPNTSTPIMWSL